MRFILWQMVWGALACGLRSLHELVMERSQEFDKEERLLLCLSLLLQRYGQPFEQCVPECRDEIEKACAFMEQNYAGRICLDQICRCAGLSSSTLLRAFAKAKGVTPYRYLENIRIGAAKKLLEQGAAPVEAAMRTGFSDQSHFTNYFSRFIGLSPGAYRDIFLKREDEKGETNITRWGIPPSKPPTTSRCRSTRASSSPLWDSPVRASPPA